MLVAVAIWSAGHLAVNGDSAAVVFFGAFLPQLISTRLDLTTQFIAIATRLAADPEHIDSLRQRMRQRMRESALMREEAFTRSLETLYRDTWREWCEKRR